MTPEQYENLVELYREHLRPFGYPDCDPNIVFQELPELWEIAKSQGIIPAGLSYQVFEIAARQSCQMQWLKSKHSSRFRS